MRIAWIGGGHESVGVDCRYLVAVAREAAQARDVFSRAIRPDGDGLELHFLARLAKQNLRGSDFEIDDLLCVLLVILGARFEPAAEDVVLPAARLVSLTTFVHVGVGRFDKDQAFQRLLRVGPLRVTLQKLFVIGLEVIAEEREAKAAAALKAAVAATAVAAEPAKQRADVLLKAGLLRDVARREALAYGRQHVAGRGTANLPGNEQAGGGKQGEEASNPHRFLRSQTNRWAVLVGKVVGLLLFALLGSIFCAELG